MNKKNIFTLVLFIIFSNIYACAADAGAGIDRLDEKENSHTILIETYRKSSKFAVHIGFPHGLPENSIMHSKNDALYFSLNGAFPKTSLMPKLDRCSYVLVTPIDDDFLSSVVSFHPTEILRIGDFSIGRGSYIIAPEGAKLPACYPESMIRRYKSDIKDNTIPRNAAVDRLITDLNGLPLRLQLDAKNRDNWSNDTPALYRGTNFNDQSHYAGILERLKIPYSCPAYDPGRGVTRTIGHLHDLRGAGRDPTQSKAESLEAFDRSLQGLTRYLDTLDHIPQEIRAEFIDKIDLHRLRIQNTGCCVIL